MKCIHTLSSVNKLPIADTLQLSVSVAAVLTAVKQNWTPIKATLIHSMTYTARSVVLPQMILISI